MKEIIKGLEPLELVQTLSGALPREVCIEIADAVPIQLPLLDSGAQVHADSPTEAEAALPPTGKVITTGVFGTGKTFDATPALCSVLSMN